MAKCGLKHSKCILESVGKKEVDSVICRKTGNSWVYLGTRDILNRLVTSQTPMQILKKTLSDSTLTLC